MIERQVDIIQRIANLMRDRRREPAHDGCFFRVVKFCFQLARPAEFYRHLIELLSQRAHLVLPPAGGNSKRKISASDAPRSDRQGFDWTREAPDDERGQAGCD